MKRTNLELWICQAEGLDTLRREDLERLQLQKLNAMLDRQAQRQGFYRNLPQTLNALEELKNLPFTTADMLSKHSAGMNLVSSSQISRIVTDTTSGTTGAAKRVFFTQQDQSNTIGFFAAGLSELVFPGNKTMIALPVSGPGGLTDLIAQAIVSLGGIPIVTGTTKCYQQLFTLLMQQRPQTYVGMPIPLLALLRFCDVQGVEIPLERALLSADACPKNVIREIEERLGSRTFPHYGLRETVFGCAVTCQAHKGMHIRENHILAEIIDEVGDPLPDGQEGELVITTIGMEAMPLLRYRTGDRARLLPGACPCGGVTKRMECFGRLQKKREEISMGALDELLFSASAHLIDYKASIDDGEILLSVLHNGNPCGEILTAAASKQYPAYRFSFREHPCTPRDTALYSGKRILLSQGPVA